MSEKGREPEFAEALDALETALAAGIRAFARWYADSWTMTREQWLHDFDDPPPEGDWFDGHAAALDGIGLACDHFLDEFNFGRDT